MSPARLPIRRLAAGLLSATALAACAPDQLINAPQAVSGGGAVADGGETLVGGRVMVCKKGGPAGTYHFSVTLDGGGDWDINTPPLSDVAVPFDGVNMRCIPVAYTINPETWVGKTATVTVTELVPAGMQVDSIEIYNSLTGVWDPSVIASATISRPMTFGDLWWFKYFNSVKVIPPPPPGKVEACKVGGPAGTYNFQIDVIGGGTYSLPNGNIGSVNFNGTDPSCVTLYVPTGTWAVEQLADLEISEVNNPVGVQTKSVTVITNGNTGATANNTSSTTASTGFSDLITVNFVNELTERLGVQGCTPGYWKVKQHHDSWVGTGYTTTQALGTVFIIPVTYTYNNAPMGNATMLKALSFQGGSTLSEKAEILLRAAVAAVLNSSNNNVDYAMTTTDIINSVNAALAGGSPTMIINLAGLLDRQNNGLGGCPLN